MTKNYHEPVLIKEIIEFLNCKPDGTFIDVTLGGGGYAERILEACGSSERVIGFDRDEEAIKEANKRLEKFSDRFEAVKATFTEVDAELKERGVNSVDGIVADLGVSSHQFDAAERGFSFQGEAELDMRMDREQELTAYDLVNRTGEKELADMIFEF